MINVNNNTSRHTQRNVGVPTNNNKRIHQGILEIVSPPKHGGGKSESHKQQDTKQRSLSPLRYPGGKSRAVKHILPLIVGRTQTLISPFIGGGAIEIAAADSGVQVLGFDVLGPLTDFWHWALTDAKALAERVAKFHPLSQPQFQALQAQCEGLSGQDRAAVFFVLNRASFSGLTLSGGMAGPRDTRFTPSAIRNLGKFRSPNLQVSQADFRETLSSLPVDFAYLDPPYLLKHSNLYGVRGDTHKHFDHAALASALKQRKSHWLLSYNDCPAIRQLYAGHVIQTPAWSYGMSKAKQSSEVLIYSDGLSEELGLHKGARRLASEIDISAKRQYQKSVLMS